MKNGFTLIELLTVISIIAILSSFVLPNIVFARYRAQAASLLLQRDNISKSLRAHSLIENPSGDSDWPTPASIGGNVSSTTSYLHNANASFKGYFDDAYGAAHREQFYSYVNTGADLQCNGSFNTNGVNLYVYNVPNGVLDVLSAQLNKGYINDTDDCYYFLRQNDYHGVGSGLGFARFIISHET